MDCVCTSLTGACALCVLLFGGAVVAILALWYAVMLRMFGGWIGTRMLRGIAAIGHGKVGEVLHIGGDDEDVGRRAG